MAIEISAADLGRSNQEEAVCVPLTAIRRVCEKRGLMFSPAAEGSEGEEEEGEEGEEELDQEGQLPKEIKEKVYLVGDEGELELIKDLEKHVLTDYKVDLD
ncbi:hypothetical protein SEMRO_2887_G339400.1 [Seminavis robusta]|uniref:Uncharacterized protein n=1 Tax=Seminavis robusta TaxID=568900 RepID=A0A9N8F2R8_9STRA|nr:hypothetical protein SEMRO_2887_G339400.1 [Seminavis robusta]|eukprot:Sro2887_g339400.1 n/a (101) ;mRNA; f:4709-5011